MTSRRVNRTPVAVQAKIGSGLPNPVSPLENARMPTPTTAKWPKPKSEDEFEDIATDFLRIRWKDPHASRNGRRGQGQHGVDVVGHPSWQKKPAGAQSKNTESPTLAMVRAEVEKAKGFGGGLSEFLFVTTADRDAALQAAVREQFAQDPAPFHVEIVFWPDITGDLAGHDDLVAKHWKGFSGSSRRNDDPNVHVDAKPTTDAWQEVVRFRADELARRIQNHIEACFDLVDTAAMAAGPLLAIVARGRRLEGWVKFVRRQGGRFIEDPNSRDGIRVTTPNGRWVHIPMADVIDFEDIE